jgi:PII-like signaling protein
MNTKGEATLLRIFISSTDKFKHASLSESIVLQAKEHGLAGATISKCIMGFGASSIVHSYKFWETSEKIPVVVEIIDEDSKVLAFYEVIRPFLESMHYGCLVTTEKVNVMLYKSGDKKII